MKTIEVFIKEIEAVANLQKEIKAIKDKDAHDYFFNKIDVSRRVQHFIILFEPRALGFVFEVLLGKVAGGYRR